MLSFSSDCHKLLTCSITFDYGSLTRSLKSSDILKNIGERRRSLRILITNNEIPSRSDLIVKHCTECECDSIFAFLNTRYMWFLQIFPPLLKRWWYTYCWYCQIFLLSWLLWVFNALLLPLTEWATFSFNTGLFMKAACL